MKRFLIATGLALVTSSQLFAATLTDSFTFDAGFANATGSAAATGVGTVAGGTYDFAPNQGLTVSGIGGLTDYSIELNVQIASTSGYVKLMDFSGLTQDFGLYNDDTAVDFYNYSGEVPGVFTANTFHNIVLTYDSIIDTMNVYVDGAKHLTIEDTNDRLPAALTSVNFVEDDVVTGKREAEAGSIDYLRIYDGVLSDTEVSALVAPAVSAIPLPASSLLLLAGVAGMASLRRRKPSA